MQIPEKLKIMAHEYSIEFDPEQLVASDSQGCCSSNICKIKISPHMPESNQAEVFLHEIIEALKYRLQLQLEHRDLSLISEGLLTVIRDNDLDFRRSTCVKSLNSKTGKSEEPSWPTMPSSITASL